MNVTNGETRSIYAIKTTNEVKGHRSALGRAGPAHLKTKPDIARDTYRDVTMEGIIGTMAIGQ